MLSKLSTQSLLSPVWDVFWSLPLFSQYNPSRQDLQVKEAWAQGFTGRGVVITILDDGIEKDHPDLVQNYVSIFLTSQKSQSQYCPFKV